MTSPRDATFDRAALSCRSARTQPRKSGRRNHRRLALITCTIRKRNWAKLPREMFNLIVCARQFEFCETAVADRPKFTSTAWPPGIRMVSCQNEDASDYRSARWPWNLLLATLPEDRTISGFVQLPCNLGMTEALTRFAISGLDGQETGADGASGEFAGNHARGERRDVAGKIVARLATVRSFRAGIEYRRRTRATVCALNPGHRDGLGGHEPRRTCARKPFSRGSFARLAGRIFEIVRTGKQG